MANEKKIAEEVSKILQETGQGISGAGRRAADIQAIVAAQRKPRSKAEKDTITEKIDALLAEIPVPDLLIMAAGAYAGSRGYTPMTSLIGGKAGEQIAGLLESMRAHQDAMKWTMPFLAFGPLPLLMAILFPVTPESPPEDVEEKKAAEDILALACIGMIEAYMMTRPGVLPALIEAAGQAVQGLGKGIGTAAGALGAV